jgi:predicted ATPase/class 3 adenylate cyclase
MPDRISLFSSPNGLTTTMALGTDTQPIADRDYLPEMGTRVGGEDGHRFELVDLLGRGAMGAVFLARDHLLERTVAVKFIIHSRAHASRDEVVELFRQEARTTARLNHENIMQVFDLGTWNDTPFLVMEHMVGQSLDSLVHEGEPFDALRATHVIADIARALAHAHRAGIVHRDLKPSNIFILKNGRAKILDFGVATITRAQGPSSSAMIAGTPLYMSPEQWRGEQQDGRADLWAAGMLFFELLTGRRPTDERDFRHIRAQMLSPEPLRSVRDLRPELPEEANALVGRALSKDKEERFASADEFLDAVVGLEMVLRRALRAASHSDQSADVPPRASQRQVTLVSFRLVRLASLAEELDLEAFADLCAGFFESGRTVVRQLEGAVVSAAGGHLLAGFGYPVAHEDDAQRAVRAALLVIEGVRGIARQIGANAAVRVGVHTGAVLVGRDRSEEGAILQGEAPEIAVWLSQTAEPDTIAVSARTAALTSWLFDISSLGTRTPGDGGAAMEVLRVDRQRPVASRFEQAALSGLTPLVGREADVAQLERLWAKTRAGKGQFVLVAGEAGIGKSRLVEELKDTIVGRAGTRLTGQCWPYFSNAAFHPLIEVAQRSMEIVPEDPPADKIHKLEKLLRTLGLPLHDHVPPLANLLSIPTGTAYPPLNLNPDMFKLRLLDSLSEVLLRSTEARPALLVIEDVHWSDESTQQLLGMLLDRIVNARLLVLLTFRPEYQHAWPPRAHLHRIDVTRLPSRVTAALVALASRGRSLPERVIAALVARTDGIPLFVEELTRMVVESWPSAAGGSEETAAPGDAVQFSIPATLHELLLARLDRLAGAGKDVAQLGAVLGREFTFKLIERASHIDGDHLRGGLMQLVEAGLIRRQEHATGTLYVFKHALVQEAAYGSLLKTDRKRHHRRVAETIERDFTDVAAQQPELLAHHFAEAGAAEQATAYLDKAGARAVQRSAHTDAITHYQRAIALVDELPESEDRARSEVRLRLALGTPLMAVRGFAHADCEANYARAIALCRSLGDDSQVFPATLGLWQFSMVRGRLALSIDLGRTLLSQAEATRDRTSIMFAHRALGTSSLLVGDLVGGRDHTTRGLALYDPTEHGALWARFGHDPGVAHGLYRGWSLALLGHMDQAVAAARGALHLARSQQQPVSIAFALCYLCIIENHRGDFSSALAHADQAARVSADHSLALWAAMSRIQCGWALLGLGELERGSEVLREGVKGWMGTGAFTGVTFFGAVQAWGHLLRDRPADAERAIEEGTELENRNGEYFYRSELVRLRGEVIRAARPHAVAEAEAQYRKALEIADSQSAHTFAIKTAVSLGRLLADTGRGAEARALVESTNAWFTEGFDTVDLVTARAFVDQLHETRS